MKTNEEKGVMQNIKSNRYLALDVMRGITIMGMILVNNPGRWDAVYAPLSHAQWNGITPTDLVFPFFMFIMGVAMFFSLSKYPSLNKNACWKILKRTVLLFIVGMFAHNFGKLCNGTLTFENVRIMGVIQRLAIVYGIGAFIFLTVPKKYLLWIVGTLLISYTILLQLFNGYVHTAGNLGTIIDTNILGATHMITENGAEGVFPFEPQSLLGTLSCIAHVIFGIFVGGLIKKGTNTKETVRQIALFGTILFFIGFLWQYLDPINKKLWTSSFTLVTCGGASLLLALLIDIIDIRKYQSWSRPFEVFGVNPLFLYVLSQVNAVLFKLKFIPYDDDVISIHNFILNHIIPTNIDHYLSSLIYALLFVLFHWVVGYLLYRKRIYIKL